MRWRTSGAACVRSGELRFDVQIAGTPLRRLVGIVGVPQGGAVLLVSCCDVHTFGLRRAIDVAFIDAGGRVVAAHRGVSPGRRLKCTGACLVAERWADPGTWFLPGDQADVSEAIASETGGSHRTLSCDPRQQD